jgi:transcriptional regulator with XRE-family HTH domain
MEFKTQLGKQIKAIREHRKLTQVELAKQAGLAQGFISTIERGGVSVNVEDLLKIIEALGVSVKFERGKVIFYQDWE